MNYSTLNQPTDADVLFVFTNFSLHNDIELFRKPSFTVTDCLQTSIYLDEPTMTLQKATIFIDIDG